MKNFFKTLKINRLQKVVIAARVERGLAVTAWIVAGNHNDGYGSQHRMLAEIPRDPNAVEQR